MEGNRSVWLNKGIGFIHKNIAKVINLETLETNNVCSCDESSQIIEHEGTDVFVVSKLEVKDHPETKLTRIFQQK